MNTNYINQRHKIRQKNIINYEIKNSKSKSSVLDNYSKLDNESKENQNVVVAESADYSSMMPKLGNILK